MDISTKFWSQENLVYTSKITPVIFSNWQLPQERIEKIKRVAEIVFSEIIKTVAFCTVLIPLTTLVIDYISFKTKGVGKSAEVKDIKTIAEEKDIKKIAEDIAIVSKESIDFLGDILRKTQDDSLKEEIEQIINKNNAARTL